jgi:transposase-like protein
MPARSIPPSSSLTHLFYDQEKCITFLIERGILKIQSHCKYCDGNVKRNGIIFRCSKDSCRKSLSIFNGSFFANNKIKCNEVLHLGYLWLTNCSYETMLHHTVHSGVTITQYNNFFRQLVSTMIDSDDTIIGGKNVIVQIDETKLGKRKNNRGHHVEGAWVIVGVELTVERKVFAEVVEDRSSKTIRDVISRHISKGSIIQTDCWKGYSGIDSIFDTIQHQTVNHSKWFKDPTTGVNTNTVEGTNYAIKKSVQPRNRTKKDLPLLLDEFVWRRKNSLTLWESFINALKEVSYD